MKTSSTQTKSNTPKPIHFQITIKLKRMSLKKQSFTTAILSYKAFYLQQCVQTTYRGVMTQRLGLKKKDYDQKQKKS